MEINTKNQKILITAVFLFLLVFGFAIFIEVVNANCGDCGMTSCSCVVSSCPGGDSDCRGSSGTNYCCDGNEVHGFTCGIWGTCTVSNGSKCKNCSGVGGVDSEWSVETCSTSTSCGGWGGWSSQYCSGNSSCRDRSRTCTVGDGCSGGSCNSHTETETDTDCDSCDGSRTVKQSEYECCSPSGHPGQKCTCQKWLEEAEICYSGEGCIWVPYGYPWTTPVNCEDHCTNGIKDCDEEGVDCGGAYCPACTCWSDADCDDADNCTQNICEVPGTNSCIYPLWCSGADTECGCELSCENCNNQDGWYDIGTANYSCCDKSGGKEDYCTCQDQEYRDYSCSDYSCSYSVEIDPETGQSHRTLYSLVEDCNLSDNWYDVVTGNDGVIQGATYTNDTSPHGGDYALEFDGVDDYVGIPDSDALDINSEISFEAWIKIDNLPSETGKNQAVLRKGGEYLMRIDGDNRIHFFIYDGVDWESRATASPVLSKNQWYHITATMSFDGITISKKLYINGILRGSDDTQTGIISATTDDLLIGHCWGNEFFDGKIDEVRIYNRALSGAEVLEHHNGTFKDETGLMGLWHMDEGVIEVPGPWFDNKWKYRKPIDVTGSSSDLSDYQTLLTIDTAELISQGKMNGDCSDIRITDLSETTEISFWLEEGCNTDSTKIWVKIPSIPIAGTTVYMYYGNSDAVSASSGINTFELFDDFSTDTDGLWNKYSDTNSYYYCRPLDQTLTSARMRWSAKLHSVNSIFWAGFQYQGLTDTSSASAFANNYTALRSSYNTDIGASATQPSFRFSSRDGTTSESDGSWTKAITEGNTYLWELAFNSSNVKIDVWDTSGVNKYSRTLSNYPPNRVGYHFIQHFDYHGDAGCTSQELRWYSGSPNYLRSYTRGEHYHCSCYVEYHYYWMFVTKYALPEPSLSSIGGEQLRTAGYEIIDTISQTCAGGYDCSFQRKEYRDYYCTPDCDYNVTDYETISAPCTGCALEGESCASMSCCLVPPALESLTCVDYICRVCTAPTCSADGAKDYSISEMGDSIDDIYCTWNIHDGCCVQQGVETVDGSNNPDYWEGESCENEGGGIFDMSSLHGEKKVYIDDINDYNIKGNVCVDDYNFFEINGVQVNVLENGSVGCTGLQDVRSFFHDGWNTIKFKAVDTCSGNRYMDIDWEIKPRFPFLNGIPLSSSEVSLSWSDRGTGITYSLWNFDTSSYVYDGTGTSFIHTGLDSNTTYSYRITASKNGYLSEEDGPPLYRDRASVTTRNDLPIADAGECVFTVLGYPVNLDGLGSYDPDGDPITYRWDYKGNTNGNLISRWYFDENLGDIAYDTSGANNNDGTLKPASPVWTTGKVGNALEFDGVNDYVDCGNDASLQLGINMTVEAWINPSSNVLDWARIVGKGDNINRNYGLWRESDGDILWQIYNADLNGNCWNNGGPGDILNASVGNWMHIVGTYNGTDMKIYTNGVLRKACPYDKIPCASFDPTTIGYVDFHTYFNGVIDEVRIYNRALSEDEIENLYEFGMETLISADDPFSGNPHFSPTPVFTPNTIGVYHIDLTVTDSYGGFSVDTVSITVADPTVCGDNVVEGSEECDGTATEAEGSFCPPSECQLDCTCQKAMPAWKEVHPRN